ncbi:MAG: VOC family protein, partial [Acetobacteraceae bacterium]
MQQDKLIRVPLLPLLLALFLLAGLAAPAAARPLQLPPVTVPATHQYHTGEVIFVELVTSDLAAAERFYGGLLGWTFRDIAAGNTRYAEATLAGQPVAGLFQRRLKAGEHRRPAWL